MSPEKAINLFAKTEISAVFYLPGQFPLLTLYDIFIIGWIHRQIG
jgi:hypothetical protein